jgi:GT2 family glycosyltransferase
VIVAPSWLKELVIASPEAAVVTSLVTRPGFDSLGARLNIWGRIVPVAKESAHTYVPFFPDGSAFLFQADKLGQPFDPDYFLYLEDVSLGWRARLLGYEVRLAPLSLALNADGGTTRRTPFSTAFYTERNRWLNYFTLLSFGSLLRLLPALFADALVRLIAGSNRRAKLYAWGWLVLHPRLLWRKRARVQACRRCGDEKILPLLSGRYLAGSSFVNRFFGAYFWLVGANLGA